MPRDLRAWLQRAEELGELVRVRGAHWDLEIGAIVDLYQMRMGRPALLFEEIPGYPAGYRVAANALTSLRRINMTLGLDPELPAMDLIHWWRKVGRARGWIPPEEVAWGPVLEHVQTGDEVDLWKFPVPRWHEHDGGRYIGTGCLVIQRDPDTGWVNVGTYRVQVQDRNLASVMITAGKQGRMILEKYWSRGEPCPVAVCVGQDPLLLFVSGLEIPWGVSEYEVAGGLLGEPVQVVRGPTTGLPVPAHGELVIEGFIHPGDRVPEGPFGEWTGYYAGGQGQEPAIRVTAVLHRSDPIILGNIPAPPPCDDTYYRGFLRAAEVWDQLEACGIPGIQGVWAHEAGGSRQWLTISIHQRYPGHSKQVGLAAAAVQAGAYANKYVVVVDDDIDPTDIHQVIWAMCTRVDPVEDVEILRRQWSSGLDPTARHRLNARMVIDACRPWEARDRFPRVARASRELQERVKARFPELFPPTLGF